MLVIPTQRGGVPFITPHLLDDILTYNEEKWIFLSVFDAIGAEEGCSATSLSYKAFCGYSANYKVLQGIYIPFFGNYTIAPTTNNGIYGETTKGRACITPEKLCSLTQVISPEIFISLYDSFPLEKVTSKKYKTMTERNRKWTLDVISKWKKGTKNEVEETSLMLPYSTLTSSLENIPDDSLKTEIIRDLSGVWVDNVGQYESTEERLRLISQAAKVVFSINPDAMLATMAESLPMIILSVHAGATHIASAIPFLLADMGLYLKIRVDFASSDTVIRTSSTKNHKRQRIESDTMTEGETRYKAMQPIRDPTGSLCMEPLMSSCSCMACRKHTIAYIHHLYNVDEMNGVILLAIHNLTQIVHILRAYRQCSSYQEKEKYVQWILSQF